MNKFKGETIVWPDSSSDDYIHRPKTDPFHNMCSYKMCMNYKKIYKSKQDIAALNEHDNNDDDMLDYERALGQGWMRCWITVVAVAPLPVRTSGP